MTYHSTVLVGRSNGERRVWTEHTVEFRTNSTNPYNICRALGRAAYRKFGTEWVCAEKPIYEKRGTVVCHAAPSVIYEGLHDAWVRAQLN